MNVNAVKQKKIVWILGTVWISSLWAVGQGVDGGDAGAIRQRSTEMLERFRMERKILEKSKNSEGIREGVETEALSTETPAEQQRIIPVLNISTTPSEILSEAEIRQITGRLEGKTVSLKDIFDVVNELNELYRAKNYVTAKAILPPQRVEDGVIQIKLIEGRVGVVSVVGAENTRERYILNRLSLDKGELVRLDELEKNLLFFNRTNDLRVRTELAPGSEFGTTDFLLKAEEPPQFDGLLFSDNTGRETVGLERIGFSVTNRSLLGFRDPLTLSGVWADGTDSAYAQYEFPINRHGTRVGLVYDYNRIEINKGPLKDLDVAGHSYNASLEMSHPLIILPNSEFRLFLALGAKKSTTEFDNVDLFETSVRTLTLGGSCQRYDEHGITYLNNRFTQGFDIFGGDKQFFKYNIDFTRTQELVTDVIAILRASGQLSDSNLLPSTEQFQIGGLATVRGYPEGFLIGDDGYHLSTEISFPLPLSRYEIRGRSLGNRLKGTVFLDHGGAFPFKGNGESMTHEDYLTSAGLGLIINVSKYLSGKMSWGFPIADRGRTDEHMRFHFFMQSTFL